ncbi:MAG TPA: TetR/AcrR family transcriptional regulator [Trueperaceae bacterium]
MPDLPQPATARGEATRRKLLDAAELEFGEKGFHSASISSITGRAGVAQGTFYLYFPSKEEILRELVRYMGRELRRSLSAATARGHDRLEVERLGLRAFVEFSLRHENLYRVVMQSQFVDEQIYREYYLKLAQGYSAALERAQQAGEVRSGDAESQAWALMGLAHFLGLRFAIWEKREPPAEAMETLYAFIEGALSPEVKER